MAETGRQVEVRPCDTITVDEITSMKPTGIIISPGPKGPADAKESLDIVREFKNTMPILGVCLGMQILAHTPGLPWYAAKKPMHGKITAIHHEGTGLFKGLPTTFDVTRYHSLVVQKKHLAARLSRRCHQRRWGRYGHVTPTITALRTAVSPGSLIVRIWL